MSVKNFLLSTAFVAAGVLGFQSTGYSQPTGTEQTTPKAYTPEQVKYMAYVLLLDAEEHAASPSFDKQQVKAAKDYCFGKMNVAGLSQSDKVALRADGEKLAGSLNSNRKKQAVQDALNLSQGKAATNGVLENTSQKSTDTQAVANPQQDYDKLVAMYIEQLEQQEEGKTNTSAYKKLETDINALEAKMRGTGAEGRKQVTQAKAEAQAEFNDQKAPPPPGPDPVVEAEMASNTVTVNPGAKLDLSSKEYVDKIEFTLPRGTATLENMGSHQMVRPPKGTTRTNVTGGIGNLVIQCFEKNTMIASVSCPGAYVDVAQAQSGSSKNRTSTQDDAGVIRDVIRGGGNAWKRQEDIKVAQREVDAAQTPQAKAAAQRKLDRLKAERNKDLKEGATKAGEKAAGRAGRGQKQKHESENERTTPANANDLRARIGPNATASVDLQHSNGLDSPAAGAVSEWAALQGHQEGVDGKGGTFNPATYLKEQQVAAEKAEQALAKAEQNEKLWAAKIEKQRERAKSMAYFNDPKSGGRGGGKWG